MRKKIIDSSNFEKDTYSKAVVCTNSNALLAYKKQRNFSLNTNKTKEDLDNLKKDVAEMKSILLSILTKINN